MAAIISNVITSLRNKRVAAAARLKKRAMRERDRRFLVEGVQGVLEALASGAPVAGVFHSPLAPQTLAQLRRAALARPGTDLVAVSDEVMHHLTSTVTPQGVVAVAEFVDVEARALPPPDGIVLVLVEVRDPGNAGTILRSADASGAAAVVFTDASVDVYNPKTVRASAGSLFHLPVVRDAGLEATIGLLRERGFTVLAASADGERSIHETDMTAPTAILVGNEARGLGPQAVALADGTLRVPIEGSAESLNLAAAATVILFEAARQRTGAGLSQIVAGAAHDLRSPLTALRGFASTLVSRWDRLTDEQRLMMLEGVAHDASRMDVIVTQLVDASRIATGRLRLSPSPTNLREVAERLAEEITRWGAVAAEVEPAADEPSAAEEAPVVWVDPVRLRTILIALVDAVQWWGERGPARLSVHGGPRPGVEVWRDGTSLDPAAADALFRAREPGTGGGSKVGLLVAKALAEAHGGRLAAEVGEAVRFRLSFPPRAPDS